jgi:hypothetical protein
MHNSDWPIVTVVGVAGLVVIALILSPALIKFAEAMACR